MPTLYQRALGLSAVVLLSALVVLGLVAASASASRQHVGALQVREAVREAGWAVAELRRTRDFEQAGAARTALQRGGAAADALPDADAAAVRRALAQYEAGLGRLVTAIRARGVDEASGAEGAFRASVHAVEARVEGEPSALLVPVLQARRREKDYLLRRRVEYIAAVRGHVAEAQAAARAALPTAKADSVVRLLDDYHAHFLELVRLIGVVDAESARIEAAAAAAQDIVDPVAQAATRRAGLLGALALAAAFLSAIVVGAAVVIQARSVTRPVARLREGAVRIARGDTAARVSVEGPDEMWMLADALNGVAEHATRRAAAERELAETQQFLSAVLDRAEEGVVVLDPDYRIVYANPYAERVYRTTLEAVRGRRPDELFPYVVEADRRSHFERALGGEVCQPSDLPIDVGGQEVWLSATYAPMWGTGGVRGVVVTLHDVTDRVAAERALREAKDAAEEAARLKSAFLANMSHEIRTPLTGILGYADLIATEAAPDVADLAEVIGRSGQRLLDTLNSVLDIAQLESGSVALRSDPVDASAAVAGAAELFATAAARAGLALTVEAAPGVVVRADGPALARVLANLVSNALKFTSHGGVTLRLWEDDGEAVAEVADTGIGMSPAFMARMFDEFQQESTGHARSHEGNGLGLAIVRRLCDLMGAALEVESERGRGTTFRVRLPLAQPELVEADA